MTNVIDRIYEILFCKFILENTPILEIDQIFNNIVCNESRTHDVNISNLLVKFVTIPDNASFTQGYNVGNIIPGVENFRLISYAHTSRLQRKDIIALEKIINENSEDALNQAFKIVKETYKMVMCTNPEATDTMTCLGPYNDEQFCFDDDAIVLGIVIDEDCLSNVVKEEIRKIALHMKKYLFKDISRELGTKIELYVPID